MEQDPIMMTLSKLKRQNQEMTIQKDKINDLKRIKRAKKNNEIQVIADQYHNLCENISALNQKQQELLAKMSEIINN